MKALKEFYQDTETKNNVHEYLVQFLKDEVVRLAFDEKEVIGAVLAKNSIDKAFENLDVIFQPKFKKKEPVNQAR